MQKQKPQVSDLSETLETQKTHYKPAQVAQTDSLPLPGPIEM